MCSALSCRGTHTAQSKTSVCACACGTTYKHRIVTSPKLRQSPSYSQSLAKPKQQLATSHGFVATVPGFSSHKAASRQHRFGSPIHAAQASQSTTEASKVAVLGIGLMGNKIARRLAEQGCTVAAWNRNVSKAQALSEAGIAVHDSAQQAIQDSDIVLLMLSDASAIHDVLLNSGDPVDLKGKIIIQMGTIGPKESVEIATKVQEASAEYLEAPVLGSQPEASKGTLLIMVGSETNPKDSKAWPVLTKLSQEPKHMGAVGTAAATKLALNQLIASLTVGFSTSLGLLQRNGANVDAFMDILRGSALYAPTFDKKLQRMLDRDYANPNFPTKHLLKDIKLFASEAEKVDLDSNLLKGLEAVIAQTVSKGLADTDYSAVHEGVLGPGEPIM